MQTVRFFLGDTSQFLVDPSTKNPMPVHSIQLLEGESQSGTFDVIDVQRFVTVADKLITQKASDEFMERWYIMQFITDPAVDPVVVLARSQPVMPDLLADKIDIIRGRMGDTNLSNPAWDDAEYISALRFCLKQYKGVENLSQLRESDWEPIELLMREVFSLKISYDFAKYYALQNPASQLNKSEISEHYAKVAAAIRDTYKGFETRLNRGGGGYDEQNIIQQMPAINVQDVSRYSHTEQRIIRGNGPSERRSLW